MATYSRVSPTGWDQGDDASASSRVTPTGWSQVVAAGGGGIVLPVFVHHVQQQGIPMIYLRQSTASQEVMLGQFVDSTDGSTPETGLTIANTDIRLQKAGSATFANKNSGGATHVESGYYTATLDATDTDTLGSGLIKVAVSGALIVQASFTVLPPQVFDSLVLGSDLLDVNTAQVSGTAQTAGDLSAQIAVVDGVVDAILVDTAEIGAAGAGLSAIPWNAAWDAEVQSEVTDALNAYDPPTNAELTARTLASADYATAAALATVDANVDDILVDTGTTIPGLLATIAGYIDTEVAAVKVVTDKLDTTLVLDGAVYQFTANALELAPTGGSAPSASDIADEVQTRTIAAVTVVNGLAANTVTASALAADAVTEIQSGLATAAAVADIPTATENADALLNRDMSAVSDTNSRSPLNALRFIRNKWLVSGATLTVYEEDDSTTAWTAAVSTSAGAEPVVGSDPA